MKILVTGGLGFVGSHAADYFANSGDRVVVFDNLSRKKLLRTELGDVAYTRKFLERHKSLLCRKGDVRDYRALADAGKEIDAILHTAGQVAVTSSIEDPRTDFEINSLGTFNVLELARKQDATVIFTSTNKVYGENVNSLPVVEEGTRYKFMDEKFSGGISEDFPIDNTSHSPYGCSKLAADMYVQDYAATYGLRTGVFRMSCIYGDRQFGVEDQGWMAWFTIATFLNHVITIYGDGKQVRDVLFVSDLVRAFGSFLKGKSKSTVFNVGGGPENTLSLLELLALLQEFSGKKPRLRYKGWRVADQKVYISNIEKANELLHWAPSVTPRQGVEKLVEWCGAYFR